MAWLNTAPERKKLSHRKGSQPTPKGEQTRLDALKAAGRDPLLPSVPDEAMYLVDYWMELGMVSPGVAGPLAITWGDMAYWQELTGRPLNTWETQVLRKMSGAYASQHIAAKDPNCPAPFGLHGGKTAPADLGQKISGFFARFNKAGKQKGIVK